MNDIDIDIDLGRTFDVKANIYLSGTPPVPPEPDTFRITVNAHPELGGSVSGGGVYESGETVMLTQAANDGYEFVMWSSGGIQVSTDSALTITVTGDAEYTAEFSATPRPKRNIVVRSNPVSGGVVSGGGEYYLGEFAILSQSANTGYTFVGWSESEGSTIVSTASTYIYKVSSDFEIVANYRKINDETRD